MAVTSWPIGPMVSTATRLLVPSVRGASYISRPVPGFISSMGHCQSGCEPHPLGYLMTHVPWPSFCAVNIIWRSSCSSYGEHIVRLGTGRRAAMSNAPWCVGPSSPTIPALSRHMTTFRRIVATSWMILSYARCENAEYMLQKGRSPSFAIPPENVTACPSAMPTSNTRPGISFIMMFSEHPVGMAGVTPTMRGFCRASSSIVLPKTSWNFGGCRSASLSVAAAAAVSLSPVSGLNFPGACHIVGISSAGLYPWPFTVCRCRSLGPFMSLSRRSTRTTSLTSLPSIGPK